MCTECVSLPINPLVSGRGFAYDDLYVAVSLDLPEGGCVSGPS